jgi:hypothetical protein
MHLKFQFFTLLAFSVGTLSLISKPAYWDVAIDFTENHEIEPNLSGELQGEIAFLQNTLVGPKRGEKKRPLLVTDRAAYLLFFPIQEEREGYSLILKDRHGKQLTLPLNPPWMEPRNDSNNKDGRPPVIFSKRAWHAVVPWEFLHPGLELAVQNQSGKWGKLTSDQFEFGPPIELVTQNVEIGMLLPPGEVQVNKWCRPDQNLSPELALDYFQMVPVARFTAAQYLPIHFPKVVLPNGNVYTERSTFEDAGVYKGDMRQEIAKGMVSTGINYANIGIPSTIGGTEKQPRPYRQTTVHTSAGMYTVKDKEGNPSAKMVRHGLSGGGGQLTLMNTTGNEFSHEYGHDHGMGHYPGGPVYSTHIRNGSWGYNLFKNRFIANIDWNGKRPETEFPYGFGHDAMAGGKPMGGVSVFTLHTPFSLRLIQENVGSQSGVLDPSSPTGYRKWNQEKQTMEVFDSGTPKPNQFGIPVMTLLGMYDPELSSEMTHFIYPALYGNWGNVFTPENMVKKDETLANTTFFLEVAEESGKIHRFPLHAMRHQEKKMNQFHINLDASVKYVKAAVILEGKELDSRKIEPPHGKLPDPVIVGREQGFIKAALRLKGLDEVLVKNGYPNEEMLHQALEDYYGPVHQYQNGIQFELGKVYHSNGAYHQAIAPRPGNNQFQFRKLGESKDYISTKRLTLGEQSIDYAKDVLEGKSGVFYYVPIDYIQVTASDSYAPAARKWYAGGEYSKLTVNSKSTNGKVTPIHLRGQINDRHVLNRGAPVNESSRVRFTFHKDDNPDLPKGEYSLQFAAYAQAWHTGKLVESFQVEGTVVVE